MLDTEGSPPQVEGYSERATLCLGSRVVEHYRCSGGKAPRTSFHLGMCLSIHDFILSSDANASATLRGSWQAYMRCSEPFAKLTFASTREGATGFDEKHGSGAMSSVNRDWAVSLAWNISHSYDSGSEKLTHLPDGPSKTPEFAKSRLMTPAARKRTL
ncbi:unnamed protein product [Boreogadus saida]